MSKFDRFLPKCPYTRPELERLRDQPLEEVPRNKRYARRLLTKFHDTIRQTIEEESTAVAKTPGYRRPFTSFGEMPIPSNASPVLRAKLLEGYATLKRTWAKYIRGGDSIYKVGIGRCNNMPTHETQQCFS